MKTTSWLAGLMLASAMTVGAATNDIATVLQRGLFEEEANRNLEAAIQAYQSVANQFDKDRRLAATAIYRLGECYRKQGNTNAATAQFERVVREFSDQSALATLSRQNLAASGGLAGTSPATPEASAASQVAALTAQIKRLQALTPAERRVAVQQEFPNPVLTDLMQKLNEAEQNFATAKQELGPENVERLKREALVRALSDQADAQVSSTMASLVARRNTAQGVSPASSTARQEQKRLLEEEIKLVQKQLDQQQELVKSKALSQSDLVPTQRDLLKLKRQLAALESGQSVDLADASPLKNKESELTSSEAEEVKRIQALIKDSPDLINAASGPGGTTPLHRAAQAGQLVVAQFLLANGADTEAKDTKYSGRTPLHYAADAGNKAMVELLLSKKANVNAADKDGTTPLHLAASSGYRSVAEVLLAHDAQVDARNKYGSTPLVEAAGQGFKSVVELMLAHGASLEAATTMPYRSQNGRVRGTALCIAAGRGDQALAEFLIAKGAAVNAVNEDGQTPLSFAVENRQEPLIKLLLEAHADPNAGSADFPVARAAWLGDLDALKLLLAKGADPNTNGKVSWDINPGRPGAFQRGGAFTPLYLAVQQLHPEAVKELIAAKADPNGLGPQRNPVIFDALWDGPTLKALLEGGADPNRLDASGEHTPLQTVFNYPDTRATAAELLLAHGANPNVATKEGWTPLHAATGYDDLAVIQLLLKKGANVNAKTVVDGRTPLHVAIEKGNAEVVKLLLEGGADPNARSNSGATPLDYAKSRPPPPGFIGSSGTMTIPFPGGGIPTRTLRLSPDTPVPGGTPSAAASSTVPPSIADLLRQSGALDDAPRMDSIQIRRSAADASEALFHKGSHDWSHYTLFELLAVEYGFLTPNPSGGAYNHAGLGFPDLAHVHIRRPSAGLTNWQEQVVDVASIMNPGDRSKDIWLKWGDVVEIPETDHPLGQPWSGLSPARTRPLIDLLARSVEVVIKGQTNKLTLTPQNDYNRSGVPFWLKPVLLNSHLLLASSDLSRVKVTRRDPATGEKREWVVDCSEPKPAPDFWLRDGDVIEVPERTDGVSAASDPSPQPETEVLQRLQALREKPTASLPPPPTPAPFQPRTNTPALPAPSPSPGAP